MNKKLFEEKKVLKKYKLVFPNVSCLAPHIFIKQEEGHQIF